MEFDEEKMKEIAEKTLTRRMLNELQKRLHQRFQNSPIKITENKSKR